MPEKALSPSLQRTLALLLVFALAKLALALLRAADGVGAPLGSPWAPVALLAQDVWAALLVGAVDGALAWLGRPRPLLGRWLGRCLWAAYGALSLYTAINVPVARVLGTPLTFPILSAAGGALSDSMAVYLTGANVLSAAGVLLAAAPAALLLRRRTTRVLPGLLILGILVLFLGPAAKTRVATGGAHRNALLTLLRTTLSQRAGGGERPIAAPSLAPEGGALDLTPARGVARGRSVIWVILESTAAQYLRPYGAADDPTPNLSGLARRGVVFDSIYAAYPESIKGLLATLCAIYPAAHTTAARYTADRLPCTSIAQRFAEAGYRTGMFHSGWFPYLGMEGVVRGRGFQSLLDAGSVGGRYATSFGVDEAATVRRALAFVDEAKGAPFFLMYLPIAGHHPYESPGPQERPRPFGTASDLARYQNDLRGGDEALGELIKGVQARGLWERTLWVVSGDHGEAFHQHQGNFAHTLFLYEENVHVPLVLLAPGAVGLDGGPRRAPQVGGVLDIAPTILELAGLPAQARAQGRSLLPPEPGTARFFTDHALWQLGLRQGRWKFIHDQESGRSQLFDLGEDPTERRDLSAGHPGRVARYREHLKLWSEQQRALILGGLAEGKE